ncbi:hypothetical protein [Aeromonas caviae]|jgi:hypothetical protein|uniref:hypothetical protein n=1 Tax=Aeromonas caviae TaxID=648 RepID=UPI00385942FE
MSTEHEQRAPGVLTDNLTPAQQAHVKQSLSACRQQLSDYLRRGVDVTIFLQRECAADIPPFAMAPVEQPDFWIGCWDTRELAVRSASELGLRVVKQY